MITTEAREHAVAVIQRDRQLSRLYESGVPECRAYVFFLAWTELTKSQNSKLREIALAQSSKLRSVISDYIDLKEFEELLGD